MDADKEKEVEEDGTEEKSITLLVSMLSLDAQYTHHTYNTQLASVETVDRMLSRSCMISSEFIEVNAGGGDNRKMKR